jgi:hypothetical protein
MSKEMREQINRVKNWKQFLNENVETIIVANIRYADDKTELEPLTKKGVLYVKRHGDTKTAYYKLNYNDVSEYGYATLGDEIPESFFDGKNVEFINSQYYKKA